MPGRVRAGCRNQKRGALTRQNEWEEGEKEDGKKGGTCSRGRRGRDLMKRGGNCRVRASRIPANGPGFGY